MWEEQNVQGGFPWKVVSKAVCKTMTFCTICCYGRKRQVELDVNVLSDPDCLAAHAVIYPNTLLSMPNRM